MAAPIGNPPFRLASSTRNCRIWSSVAPCPFKDWASESLQDRDGGCPAVTAMLANIIPVATPANSHNIPRSRYTRGLHGAWGRASSSASACTPFSIAAMRSSWRRTARLCLSATTIPRHATASVMTDKANQGASEGPIELKSPFRHLRPACPRRMFHGPLETLHIRRKV